METGCSQHLLILFFATSGHFLAQAVELGNEKKSEHKNAGEKHPHRGKVDLQYFATNFSTTRRV